MNTKAMLMFVLLAIVLSAVGCSKDTVSGVVIQKGSYQEMGKSLYWAKLATSSGKKSIDITEAVWASLTLLDECTFSDAPTGVYKKAVCKRQDVAGVIMKKTINGSGGTARRYFLTILWHENMPEIEVEVTEDTMWSVNLGSWVELEDEGEGIYVLK